MGCSLCFLCVVLQTNGSSAPIAFKLHSILADIEKNVLHIDIELSKPILPPRRKGHDDFLDQYRTQTADKRLVMKAESNNLLFLITPIYSQAL
ncbi:hypothetical protein BZK31_17115 [Pseudomonas floridensis]|uniref:Uncharacterized protein n=1 Tax=Pseudomonas floridensis TaxID=1958950 RepID=A0A1X0N524_9PSED|nr:hypothetical protein BZK31_17115 [Pseudomonas floridensis]